MADGDLPGHRLAAEELRRGHRGTLDTDVLVVGIGATLNSDWPEGSGLRLEDGVVADATLAAAPGVYVAIDVARWPSALFDDVLAAPMRLSVTLPATYGPEVIEHHLQHFAVEFRNWILTNRHRII